MGLSRADLDADPRASSGAGSTTAAVVRAPEAMAVATAAADGAPSVRMVLLKAVDERGLVFFTHYTSRKGRELEGTRRPRSSSTGTRSAGRCASKARSSSVSAEESDAYFATRPRGRADRRGRVAAERGAREPRGARAARRRARGRRAVPRPETWGGFRLVPEAWEFWQHRDDRLHDRFRYRARRRRWVSERLYP